MTESEKDLINLALQQLQSFDAAYPFIELFESVCFSQAKHAQASRGKYLKYMVESLPYQPFFVSTLTQLIQLVDLDQGERDHLLKKVESIKSNDHTTELAFCQALRALAKDKIESGEQASLELEIAQKIEKQIKTYSVKQVMKKLS